MEAIGRRRYQRRHRPKQVPVWAAPAVTPEPEPIQPQLPTWAELPATRRRRLVAVLGDLVLRARGPEGRDEPGQQGDIDADDAS